MAAVVCMKFSPECNHLMPDHTVVAFWWQLRVYTQAHHNKSPWHWFEENSCYPSVLWCFRCTVLYWKNVLCAFFGSNTMLWIAKYFSKICFGVPGNCSECLFKLGLWFMWKCTQKVRNCVLICLSIAEEVKAGSFQQKRSIFIRRLCRLRLHHTQLMDLLNRPMHTGISASTVKGTSRAWEGGTTMRDCILGRDGSVSCVRGCSFPILSSTDTWEVYITQSCLNATNVVESSLGCHHWENTKMSVLVTSRQSSASTKWLGNTRPEMKIKTGRLYRVWWETNHYMRLVVPDDFEVNKSVFVMFLFGSFFGIIVPSVPTTVCISRGCREKVSPKSYWTAQVCWSGRWRLIFRTQWDNNP